MIKFLIYLTPMIGPYTYTIFKVLVKEKYSVGKFVVFYKIAVVFVFSFFRD